MRTLIRHVTVVAGAAAMLLGSAAGVASAGAGATWGNAEEVAGTAALNQGGTARMFQSGVSCARAGTCSAGGSYSDSSGAEQAFVVSN